MKLCPKCGTPCNDTNFRCVECGAILPAPLTDEEREQAEEQISDYIADRADKANAFARTKRTYILTALDALGLILSVILIIVFQHEQEALGFLCTALIFLVIGIDTYFPKLNWTLECFRIHRFLDTDPLVPSDYYLLSLAVVRIALPVIAFFALGSLWIACSGGSAQTVDVTSEAVHVITYSTTQIG